ncbi:hypothetical protein [Streptomyces naganishii]|uniref:Radical SAM domain-containing protein n=1 Tax=Streptomyces naganishii JCM 4654 TaxID=1306179 RepID=A0A918YAJ1_9ACTN|nr:hypothetical protein [Streptomyces naganishii]GHD95933.1 hypothetical protein GCM10010508_62660 [Streptomyces naganishii JCM 4654]
MHSLIASPFLDQHVLVRPGSRGGALLPEARYEELRERDAAEPAPLWLSDAVQEQWEDLDVTGRPTGDFLLVRQPSTWVYGKASWEVNLGCNYKCKHCYLGLKVNSGIPGRTSGSAWTSWRRLVSSSSRSPAASRPSIRTSCVRTGTPGNSA